MPFFTKRSFIRWRRKVKVAACNQAEKQQPMTLQMSFLRRENREVSIRMGYEAMIKEIENEGEGKKGQDKGKEYLSQRDKKNFLE